MSAATLQPVRLQPVRLQLGRIVGTPGALGAIETHVNAGLPPLPDKPTDHERAIFARVSQGTASGLVETLIRRHATGDWGDLCAADRASNDEALRDGSRVLSAYALTQGDNAPPVKLWIITEADRASTTLLLPSEY